MNTFCEKAITLPRRMLAARLAVSVYMLIMSVPAVAQLEFESDPINYNDTPTSDAIRVLQTEIQAGDVELEYDEEHGYLKSVLDYLGVPASSQMLVFSKTSFQLRRISPKRPRAVYFNDDVYVGWVQGGDVLEFSAVDPKQGAIFYTMSQEQSKRPKITRDRGQCIVCHASSRTAGVPGHLVRSVFPGKSGQPFFGSGTFTIDHRSPFKKRWGGWYVTGTHGEHRHMGNVVVTDSTRPENLDREHGANVVNLQNRLNTDPYLTPHSDIVALMVLEHQTRMHNLITRANFTTRSALHYDKVMNKAMDRPADYRSDSAKRRIASAAEKLVEYMLFAEEFPLQHRVEGTSEFAAQFAEQGIKDSQGRSLRDFDLNRRMMKHPCSYLIYSSAFDGLPSEAKEQVYRKLHGVLTSADDDERFVHLASTDRQAILEILQDTKVDLPDYWKPGE